MRYSFSQVAGRAEELIEEAKALFAAGDTTRANGLLYDVLALLPAQPQISYLLGRIAFAEGEYQKAITLLTDASVGLGESADVHGLLGKALVNVERYEAALIPLRRCLEIAPNRDDVRRALGVAFLRLNRNREAAAALVTDRDGRVVPPSRIRIETASACNLRCQHCPTGVAYETLDRRIMKMELFDGLVGQISQTPSISEAVLTLGGEPLINKNLPVMLRRLKSETGITQTQFTTNGMLLDERMCEAIAESGVDRIWISIDGRSPEENDRIRLGARYSRIVGNVRLLMRHIGNRPIKITVANTVFRRPGDPDIAEVPGFLTSDLPGVTIWSYYALKWPGLNVGDSALAMHLEDGTAPGFCDFPFYELSIRWNGDVVPCCYDISGLEVMGSVARSQLTEIWNGPRYRDLRCQIGERKVASLPTLCRNCPLFCGEQLRAG